MKPCPFCAEDIQDAAVFCRHCNHDLTTGAHASAPPPAAPTRYWSPGIAALLSLLIPGAGSMYRGQIGLGIGWLLATTVGYVLFVVPGLILHFIGIFIAASGDPTVDPQAPAPGPAPASPTAPAAPPRPEEAESLRKGRRNTLIVGSLLGVGVIGTIVLFSVIRQADAPPMPQVDHAAALRADAARTAAAAARDAENREKERLVEAIRSFGHVCLWADKVTRAENAADVLCQKRLYRVSLAAGAPDKVQLVQKRAQPDDLSAQVPELAARWKKALLAACDPATDEDSRLNAVVRVESELAAFQIQTRRKGLPVELAGVLREEKGCLTSLTESSSRPALQGRAAEILGILRALPE